MDYITTETPIELPILHVLFKSYPADYQSVHFNEGIIINI